jgi:hypothetical protein
MRFFTSEIYINNNNPSKIGAFLTIFKDFCNLIKMSRYNTTTTYREIWQYENIDFELFKCLSHRKPCKIQKNVTKLISVRKKS